MDTVEVSLRNRRRAHPSPRRMIALRHLPSLGWLLVLGILAGCAGKPSPPLVRHEFSAVHMAIPFRIVLYSRDPVQATNAAQAAWERIAELNRILSDYDPDSELSRLGATSPHTNAVPISAELSRVLKVATDVSRASDGAFDLSVGPLTQLWRRTRRQRELPDDGKRLAAIAATDWRSIELSKGRTARLLRPGMRLDAGGIAKGYALDEATRVLREHRIRSSMVAGAGDIVATAPPPGEKGWKIEVAPLDVPGAPPSRSVLLRDASLCTSGDVFQHVEINGVRYSHIVDPHTGLGLTDHSLVTVIGRDGITTDALSTALSVAGPANASRICAPFGAEFHTVRSIHGKLETVESPGFRLWERR